MSGIGRQSTRTPRSSMPSWRTRTPPASASSSIGRPISVSTSRTCASGWSISVPSVVRIPRKRTSDGCSALAARPNAAEPMSGGRTISVGLRLLAGLDLEAAPVVGDPDLEPEVAHHAHGQLDVGLLVEHARRPRRRSAAWRTGASRSRPEIHCDSVPEIRTCPPRRARRLDGDRRPGVLGLQAHAELRERAEQRPDRAALEVLLAGQRHRRVGERREADHEVEGGARAADGHRARGAGGTGRLDDEAGLVLLDPGAEAAQDLDRRADVAGPGCADDPGLPRGERREHERAMRVVLGAWDGDLAPERTADLADEQVHGAGRLTAREATPRSGDVGSSDG